MKRKQSALTLISALLFSMVAGTQFANLASAQFLGSITIKADGTIDPADAPIQRVGDTYTLTGDVGSISVQRSNIILDGNGHTLPGKVTSFNEILGRNITALNSGGVYLKNVENVIVKNLTIKDSQYGVYLERCSNVTVSGNIITGTHVPVPGLQYTGGIFVWAGNSNNIIDNQLTNNYEAIYIGYDSEAQQNVVTGNNIENNSYGIIMGSANNNIYQNNFINNRVQVYLYGEIANAWDYDKKGNFWSDYNGTDADGDGVGDTPYVIDENNKDNYPLMAPHKEPQPTPTQTPELQEPEPFPTVFVATVSVSAIALVSAGLIIYFKKRKR